MTAALLKHVAVKTRQNNNAHKITANLSTDVNPRPVVEAAATQPEAIKDLKPRPERRAWSLGRSLSSSPKNFINIRS